MLSYQHIYHAGNFADVQKHALLLRLLAALTARPRPLHIVDTHAGRGFYDLTSTEAAKTGEHLFGVTPVWQDRANHPTGTLIGDYLDAVARHNRKGAKYPAIYPGSARLCRDHARPQDRLIAAERHPGEFDRLEESFADIDPAYTDLYHDDGLLGLTDAPPPTGCQGLLIIDPSYEIKTEYTDLARRLGQSWRLWGDATALIWYPLLGGNPHDALLQGLRERISAPILLSEIRLTRPPRPGYRMEGSGIAIINAPWPEMELVKMTGEIAKALSPACGRVMADAVNLADI